MANGESGEAMGIVASNVEMMGSRLRPEHALNPRMEENHVLDRTSKSETAISKPAVRYAFVI